MGNSACCQAVCDKSNEILNDERALEDSLDRVDQIAVKVKQLQEDYDTKRAQYGDRVKAKQVNNHVARANPNGTSYEGQMSGNFKSGWGKYTYVDPAGFYEGEWEENRAHGLGWFKDTAGEYKGNWLAGEKHGLGCETWFDDETVFKGNYVKGVKQGDGVYQWSDGSSYEGQLRDNVICGHGRLTDDEGVYVGEFLDNAQHGQGKWQYSNGDFYVGQFVDSLRHGEGTLSWTRENKQYSGQWAQGVPHGVGKVTVRDVEKSAYYINGKSCTQENWMRHAASQKQA
ncbi:unnamed protein product [Amoebophrya sp. A120]|nr:unnamed protein product [Amoebophrya sp. A120]|eukprot:GSA120T00000433001.1